MTTGVVAGSQQARACGRQAVAALHRGESDGALALGDELLRDDVTAVGDRVVEAGRVFECVALITAVDHLIGQRGGLRVDGLHARTLTAVGVDRAQGRLRVYPCVAEEEVDAHVDEDEDLEDAIDETHEPVVDLHHLGTVVFDAWSEPSWNGPLQSVAEALHGAGPFEASGDERAKDRIPERVGDGHDASGWGQPEDPRQRDERGLGGCGVELVQVRVSEPCRGALRDGVVLALELLTLALHATHCVSDWWCFALAARVGKVT